jgi:hypothetical protein
MRTAALEERVGFIDGRWALARVAWLRGRKISARLALWFFVAAVSWANPPQPGSDQIFFSKSFPGSKPEYFEIAVDSAGKASYREDPAEDPVEFQLSDQEVREVFDLAQRMNRFQAPLQSDRKVAFTGAKTLRYRTAAGEEAEAKFTYTTDSDAQKMVAWFESAGETERHFLELDRVVRFDRLGVNKALLLFQASFDNGRVVGAKQFLGILGTIAEDTKFMHMARARAAALIERIGRDTPEERSR